MLRREERVAIVEHGLVLARAIFEHRGDDAFLERGTEDLSHVAEHQRVCWEQQRAGHVRGQRLCAASGEMWVVGERSEVGERSDVGGARRGVKR